MKGGAAGNAVIALDRKRPFKTSRPQTKIRKLRRTFTGNANIPSRGQEPHMFGTPRPVACEPAFAQPIPAGHDSFDGDAEAGSSDNDRLSRTII